MRCLTYYPVLLHGEAAGFRKHMMHKLMITCFAAAGLYSHFVTANAAMLDSTTPAAPAASSTTSTAADLPYVLAKLQGDVQTLQSEVQNLQSLESQDPTDPQDMFSVAPPPNTTVAFLSEF